MFWARGDDALLVDEEGCPHSFKLIDGLHRHVPDGVTPQVLEWTKWLKEGPNPSPNPEQVLTAAPSRPRKYMMGFLIILSILSTLSAGSGLASVAGLIALAARGQGGDTNFIEESLQEARERVCVASGSHHDHCRRGHYPHDPHCSVCQQARLTAKQARRRVVDPDGDP